MYPWTVAHQTLLSMGFLQARILDWVAIPSSRGSSQPRDWTQVSCIAGRFFTFWPTREVLDVGSSVSLFSSIVLGPWCVPSFWKLRTFYSGKIFCVFVFGDFLSSVFSPLFFRWMVDILAWCSILLFSLFLISAFFFKNNISDPAIAFWNFESHLLSFRGFFCSVDCIFYLLLAPGSACRVFFHLRTTMTVFFAFPFAQIGRAHVWTPVTDTHLVCRLLLDWVAVPFSRGSSQPRDWTQVSCIAGRFSTIWVTSEALI